MIPKEIKSWISLLNIPNIGPRTFNLIHKTLQLQRQNVSDLFQMEKEDIYRIVRQSNVRKWDKIAQNIWETRGKSRENPKIFQQLTNKGIVIIPYTDENYPAKLKKRLNYYTPPIIYISGNKALFNTKSIAIIGKRKASKEAIDTTDFIVKKLLLKGYTIISGYASGVDTTAHLSALKYGGTTIIVLPFGILEFKWKKQFNEIEKLHQKTLIISQFPPNLKWTISSAMQRNKTIIGLSDAIFGVELERGGGTYNAINESLKIGVPTFVLDTAKNREIFTNFPKQPFFIKNIEDLIINLKE